MDNTLLYIPLFMAMASCSTQKETGRTSTLTDSLRQTARLVIHTSVVPESCSTLQIPVSELKELPSSALYHNKSGQASATVRLLHDTLFILASCDSLQQLVYDYQQQIENTTSTSQTKITKIRRNKPFGLYGTIIILSILLLLVVLKRKTVY